MQEDIMIYTTILTTDTFQFISYANTTIINNFHMI